MNKSFVACAVGCALGTPPSGLDMFTMQIVGVTPRGHLELSFGYRMETEPTETPGVLKVVNWNDMQPHEVLAQMNITLERFKQLYGQECTPSDGRKRPVFREQEGVQLGREQPFKLSKWDGF